MFLSNGEMEAAASQVRAIAAGMDHAVREIDLPQSWTGDDADRFQRDWHDLVHQRLQAAANKLDGVSFEEIKDLLGG
jgi:uncharacterized protein YukE